MELGAIHPGWIIGIILYALFNALMGSRHKERGGIGDGSILHEFLITLLMIVIIGGALLLLTTPISGALWKLHPVQDFGGIWALVAGFLLTIVLGALVSQGVARILFPRSDDTRTPEPDPAADSASHPAPRPRQRWQRPLPIRPASQPSPHDPQAAALIKAPPHLADPGAAGHEPDPGPGPGLPFALLEDPADADHLLPLEVIENEPPLDESPEGQRGRFTPAPKKKLPFDTNEWIRAGFQKYFLLLFGIAFAVFTISLLANGDRDWGVISGGLIISALFLGGSWHADRRLSRY